MGDTVNLDIEDNLLAMILLEPGSIRTVRAVGLKEEHFTESRRAIVFRAAVELDDSSKVVDSISVANSLRESGSLERIGVSWYHNITDTLPSCGVEDQARTIIKKHAARSAQKLATDIENPESRAKMRQSLDILDGIGRGDSMSSFSLNELMAMDMPPMKWCVSGLIPEGLTLLAGAPKVGKSWLSYQIAIAVATGEKALGCLDTETGSVLYCALEDGKRRLKERASVFLGENMEAPRNLHIELKAPQLRQGFESWLAAWLREHRDTRIVNVDTLGRIYPQNRRGKAYQEDTEALATVQSIALDFSVSCVMIHHTRKELAIDTIDEVSGTRGLTGVADSVLVLKRGRESCDGELYLTGRDVDEKSYALSFDKGIWTITGDVAEHYLGDTRKAILKTLRSTEKPMHYDSIADQTGIKPGTVKTTLFRMARDGQVKKHGDGFYDAL